MLITDLFSAPKEALSRSLFEERGGPASRINTSLSSRRPSFNASTFGSPSFVDKTLCTKRVLDSPFYSGRTIYGGASAYGRRLGHTGLDFKYSVKNPVQVKPVNDKPINDSTTLSKTARRILDTLEQYATPASDAVKIPPPTKRSSNKGLISKYIGVNPYIRKEKQPSNKELHVPTIPDLMKMKEQLQSSTEAVRKIATSSKSDVCREESEPSTSAACEYNNEEYKIPTVNENISKHSNKIKTKITAVRHKVADSAPEEVKLPNVVLPITTLPKFDFSLQPPTSFVKYDQSKPQILSTTATSKASEKEVCIREGVQAQHHSNTAEYKFSIPLIVAQNSKTVISINNFKFSKPIFEKQHKNNALNFKTIENMDFKPKRSISKNNGDIQKAQNLLEHGSVMDILGKKASNNDSLLLNKFKIQPGQWECTVCLIRNQADAVKCVACETVRKVVEPKVDNKGSTLNNLFMKTPELWTCESCKVQNKVEDSKCFACTTPRYGSQIQPLDINKFKPSSDTWECPTCLIRNKKSVEKCVACETSNPTVTKISSAKPANFGDAFKKQSNEWECESCMVKNSNDKLKCQCCEAPKPGTSVVTEKGSSLPKFSFGLDKAVVGNFKFGINPTVATSSSNSSNAALIFGQSANQISSTNATFTFGITASAAGGKKDTLSSQEGDKRQPESAKTGDILIAPTSNICDSKAPELAPSKDNGTGLTKLTEQSNLATSKTKVEVAANINNGSSILPGKGNSGLGLTNNSKENSLSATPYTFGNTPNNSSSILPKTTKEDILKPAFTSTTTTTTHLPTTSIFQNTNPFTASFKGASNTNQPTQEVKPFTFGSSQPQQTLKLLELPNSQKVAEPAKPFSFGTSSINKQQNPTFGAGGFGENLQTSPSPATFNTSTPSVTSFGNTQQTQNGGFSFGGFGNNTASKTGFTFGNTNQSNQQQAFSGFNFGSTSVVSLFLRYIFVIWIALT